MTKHYRITNETYGDDPNPVTLVDLQAHADKMARTDKTWRCWFAVRGDTIIDQMADDVVVGELVTKTRYYFHAENDAGNCLPDEYGTEVDGINMTMLSAARECMIATVHQVADCDWRDWYVSVYDEGGKEVAQFPFPGSPRSNWLDA